MNESLVGRCARALGDMRCRRPLVHNITNYVVMDFSANALLAAGASPVMAHAVEEVREMVALAGALVVNIGTLSRSWIEAMFLAGAEARARRVPVVLDPVGAGATAIRTETALRFMSEVKPTILRANASEILAVAQAGGATRGVDATQTVEQAHGVAFELAGRSGSTVAVTGPMDFVTDGTRSVRVANGHALMARVTGTGCVASALTGAFAAVEADPLVAATAALVFYGLAGELAAQGRPGPGEFRVRLLDALDRISPEQIVSGGRVVEG
ncbi:MAG: hydroxyethylthiazole kinase [Polyangiaceae bacterium]|nr:hydroxyethylthiazole kinase [Polyangiaceae bacterium]